MGGQYNAKKISHIDRNVIKHQQKHEPFIDIMDCCAAVLVTTIAIKNRPKTKGKALIIAARGKAVALAFHALVVEVEDGVRAAQHPRRQGYVAQYRQIDQENFKKQTYFFGYSGFYFYLCIR